MLSIFTQITELVYGETCLLASKPYILIIKTSQGLQLSCKPDRLANQSENVFHGFVCSATILQANDKTGGKVFQHLAYRRQFLHFRPYLLVRSKAVHLPAIQPAHQGNNKLDQIFIIVVVDNRRMAMYVASRHG